jgi:energy-coupling factor transporter ATP-binding protein EcfA2
MLLPIHDSIHKQLPLRVINELELVKVYKHYGASNRLANEIVKFYSVDKEWILQTQKVIKNFIVNYIPINDIIDSLNETQSPTEFKAKYQYIDLFKNAPPDLQEIGDRIINYSSLFHNIQSYLVYCNPLFIILPHIFQLISVIADMGSLPSFSNFIKIITTYILEYIQNDTISIISKLLTVLSLIYTPTALYFSVRCIFSWKQNTECIKKKILNINNYISLTLTRMKYWVSLNYCNNYTKEVIKSKDILTDCLHRLGDLSESVCLSEWYRIKIDKQLNESLKFSVDFNEYCNFIGIVKTFNLGNVIFSKDTQMQECKYPLIESCIGNDITINSEKPIVITGTNASGKTTIIKSFMVNCITNQQIGMGSYLTSYSPIYTKFFAYINIPDTSDRYSLFQAELANCLSIINDTHNDDNALCIFDELLTGTNVSDANCIQYAYIQYISQCPNISALVTTHNTKICKKLYKKNIIDAKQTDENTRKIKEGICYKNGGLDVIKNMGYPQSIIDNFINHQSL